MSTKTAANYCEAIEGQFAWFSQLCMKTATTTHRDGDGDEYGVCADHAATTPTTSPEQDESTEAQA